MPQALGTKAETLAQLAGRGFNIPSLLYFEAHEWRSIPKKILDKIQTKFPDSMVIVRSSALCEDSAEQSLAGAFNSILNVPSNNLDLLENAIERVIFPFDNSADQVLIQPMLMDVQISGVLMTKVMDDGSPYYVINYDDVSGKTDTITGGQQTAKTVYIYNGVAEEDFDSSRLKAVLQLARTLETIFEAIPLDIEFAVDSQGVAHLLQVRRICSVRHWKHKTSSEISRKIQYLANHIDEYMHPTPQIFGTRTMLGVMPDWNPAEMIGLVPRPLAFSLYRELITRRVWATARQKMGYRAFPGQDLMLSIAGRPYIDVRASFNSFLPTGIATESCEQLVNAWLSRLEKHPEFHDKIEFDVVHTVFDCDFASTFSQRYSNEVLSPEALAEYTQHLRTLTNNALQTGSSLETALQQVTTLHERQKNDLWTNSQHSARQHLQKSCCLLEECRQLGTLPFAIVARHAFIAEALLRSVVRCEALTAERFAQFKGSIRTIAGELASSFAQVYAGSLDKQKFLSQYGHLRPGSYDILSPTYAQREDLFTGTDIPRSHQDSEVFKLTPSENRAMQHLLHDRQLTCSPEGLLHYAHTAIAGREYSKFVFTRHLSNILECLAAWGETLNLSRAQVAMLPIHTILDTLFASPAGDARQFFFRCIREQQSLHDLAGAFKLSYLIRSSRDVYVVPQHRSLPNFITTKRVEAPLVYLDAQAEASPHMQGSIICIDSADPGYDWIFTRNIAGLITRFGGANSHMAIRCAEYALPAAIGCGSLLFDTIIQAKHCILDGADKSLRPLASPK